MSRLSAALFLLLLAILGRWAILSAATGESTAILIAVHPGWDGTLAYGKYVPMRVSVTALPGTPAVAARLKVLFPRRKDYQVVDQPITVTGGTSEWVISVPLDFEASKTRVVVESGSRIMAVAPAAQSMSSLAYLASKQGLVIDATQDLSPSPSSTDVRTSPTTRDETDATPVTIKVLPRHLPTDIKGFDAVTLLLAGPATATAASAETWSALLSLSAEGRLVWIGADATSAPAGAIVVTPTDRSRRLAELVAARTGRQ